MRWKTRKATVEDISFLWDMLYEAIYVPKGQPSPSRNVLNEPSIARFLEAWGREGDEGRIALDEEQNHQPVGAVWVRQFDEANKTYGYLSPNVSVLCGMAVRPSYRGHGIGTLLLREMIHQLTAQGFTELSLSVDADNPASRLYERHGFQRINKTGTSWNMKARIR